MYKILKPLKDTYITDRVIKGSRVYNANVGSGGSLDLFKLYGMTSTKSGSVDIPNIELSRLLIKFDLSPLRTLISQNKINILDSSFSCYLKLYDVYGGQPCPNNFEVSVYPLSKSFDEGIGNDIVYYGDRSSCNFITASFDILTNQVNLWNISGANAGGVAGLDNIDFITNSSYGSLLSSQTFTDGDENLYVNVTNTIKSIIGNEIPDEGFRISYTTSIENNNRSYFVKRFAARNAYDRSKHPKLIVKYDNSFQSDQTNLIPDVSGTITLYNSNQGSLIDIVSGSTSLTGSNCIKLNLLTEVSGGYSTYSFLGSRYLQGIYYSNVILNSQDSVIKQKMSQSGSVIFKQIWTSVDNSLTFITGSDITLKNFSRTNDNQTFNRYHITTSGIQSEHSIDEIVRLRVHITDINNQFTKLVREPLETPGLSIRDTHYSVRDFMTNEVVIPFDKTNNSTRLSSDNKGMYLELDMSNFLSGRTYIIDIMITRNDVDQVFRSVSPVFRITETS